MKKNLTFVEIMTAVVIVSILATVGVPVYRNVLTKAEDKTCITNLKVLQGAISAYGFENGVLPSSLSYLNDRQVRKAWAAVFRNDNPLLIKLAYFIVDLRYCGMAYAQEGFALRYLGADGLRFITCPADNTPPPGGVSYGLNENLLTIPFGFLRSDPDKHGQLVLLGDCDQHSFSSISGLAFRHRQYAFFAKTQYAFVGTLGGTIYRVSPGGQTEPAGMTESQKGVVGQTPDWGPSIAAEFKTAGAEIGMFDAQGNPVNSPTRNDTASSTTGVSATTVATDGPPSASGPEDSWEYPQNPRYENPEDDPCRYGCGGE